MTNKTPTEHDALRRKLISGVAVAGTTVASRTVAPAVTLLLSATAATANADPYGPTQEEFDDKSGVCDRQGRQPPTYPSLECGPEIEVVAPPFDDEGGDSDLFFGQKTPIENWLESDSWNKDKKV